MRFLPPFFKRIFPWTLFGKFYYFPTSVWGKWHFLGGSGIPDWGAFLRFLAFLFFLEVFLAERSKNGPSGHFTTALFYANFFAFLFLAFFGSNFLGPKKCPKKNCGGFFCGFWPSTIFGRLSESFWVFPVSRRLLSHFWGLFGKSRRRVQVFGHFWSFTGPTAFLALRAKSLGGSANFGRFIFCKFFL